MAISQFPAPSVSAGVTPPTGFRSAVFEGQFTGAGPHTKSATFPAGIYRLESAAANGSTFVFSNGASTLVCAAGTPVTFDLTSSSSSMSVSKPADGGTWTARTLSNTQYWTCVVYGNGLFVAFSSWGATATSPDGVTWTNRGNIAAIYAAVYAGGQFVAVGNGQNIYTSADGITWTARDTGWNVNYRDIAYGDGVYIATVPSNGNIARSTNGTSWGTVYIGASLDWRGIAYGAGKFVMVAYGSQQIAWSSNGTSWTQPSGALPVASAWYSISYGNGVFVALSTNNSTNATSTDGLTWTALTLPSTGYNNFLNMTFVGGYFVAVEEYSPVALTSTNGRTWTQRTLPSSANWTSVAGSGTGFVTVSFDYGTIAASSTGSSDTGRIAFSVFPASSTTY